MLNQCPDLVVDEPHDRRPDDHGVDVDVVFPVLVGYVRESANHPGGQPNVGLGVVPI